MIISVADGRGAAGGRRRVVATAALLAAFVALLLAVLADPRNGPDDTVMRWAAAHAWQPAVTAGNVVIGLATPLLTGAAVTLAVVLLRRRRAASLVRLGLLVVSVVVLKSTVGRSGPPLAVPGRQPILGSVEGLTHIGRTAAGALPSGHTTTAVVCAFLLLWPATATRWTAYLAWVALVSASLILLDYHWLSDVVGAWLLGAAILTVPLPLGRHWRRRRIQRAESSPCPAPSSLLSPRG